VITTMQPAVTAGRRSIETDIEIAVRNGELKLQCKNLSEFPRSLGKHFVLADTVTADLSRNKLTEIPIEFTHFYSLEKLILYHNSIKSIPDTFGVLQSLQYLDLSRNQLTYIPHAVCQLTLLQSLVLNNNKLVSLPEEIGELVNLMKLDVSCNEIAHLPVQIGDLSNLRTLSLRRNHLQEVPVELTYLQLTALDLSSNRLINLPVELRFMITLVDLNLEENPLSCPPANMCCRGRVHIFKYLETIAIKEDKKRGIMADTEHRRSYRKTSQIADMRFGAVSADARLKRHTADSGYGSEQPFNSRRWSTELHDGPDNAQAEDARRLAHRAISYRPASNSAAFPPPGKISPPVASQKPSLTVQLSHPSLTSNGSGSSGISSLSSQGTSSAQPVQSKGEASPPEKDVCDTPKWTPPANNVAKNVDKNPARTSVSSVPELKRTTPNGIHDKIGAKPWQSNGSTTRNGNIGSRKPELQQNRNLSLNNLERTPINGNAVDTVDSSKKSILKSTRTNSNQSLTGKLPVPNQALSPRHSPTSPNSSNLSSPNSAKNFGPAHSNPNSSGLPSPTTLGNTQSRTTNFQTYRQFKEQQKLNRQQTDSVYKSETKSYSALHGSNRTGVEIRSYYERMQTQTSVPRAGAPPETSPPPPPPPSTQSRSSSAVRTAIPTASRSPSSASAGSIPRSQPGYGGRSTEKQNQFTVRRETERTNLQDMHIQHLRQNIEQRLKISLGDDLSGCLSDGVVLCHMANHVSPRAVNSIHVPSPAVPKLSSAKCRRNVENFVSACRKIGVREDLICSATDIIDPNRNHTVRIAITVTELLRFKPV